MSNIYNYYEVSEMLACSGQPREGQLASIAQQGYTMVINLGLLNTNYSLRDEAGAVDKLGLAYHHIPVVFESPQIADLVAFITIMNSHLNQKKLVHCAANYRASCFTGLYLFSSGEMTEDEMTTFIKKIWRPDYIWEDFVEDGVEYIRANRDSLV